MSAWFVSMGLVAALLGQAEADTLQSAADEVIARAISELGDAKFSVRRRASQVLWQQGLAAEPALRKAAKSVDRETRIRAQHILNDFAYGILPGVPADIVALIRQFRDGPANGRSALLQRLADRDRFETIQRLIQLEPDPGMRRQLLVTLMQNPQAVERFFEPERLEKLVAAVGADRDELWRRTVLAQLLFSQKVIQHLAKKGRLDVLTKIVERERSADVRRQMLSMLFQNPAAVTSLVENAQLQFVLKVIAKEPDEKTRGAWIGQLLAMSGVIQQLASDDRLENLLKFAQDNVDDEQRGKILQQLFRNSSVLKAILEKRGIERLIALTNIEKDGAARGANLAALVTSMAVRESLTETGQRELAIKLARQEKDATARSEYLQAILTSVIGYTLVRHEENRNALWALIKADSGKRAADLTDWRGVAILRILTMSSGSELLRDQAEAKWLMQFLRDDMSPEDRASIVERLVMDYRLRKSLLEHKHFPDLLGLVKQLPASQRGRVMGQLFASMGSVDPFGGKDDVSRAELMVSLAREETDDRARRQFLQALFQNSSAMNALIAGEFYDDLWSLILAEKDPLERAILRGEFLRSSSVVQAVRDKKQLDSLLNFAQQAEDLEVRREYLKRLFGSRDAMSELIDKGHYDALYALANDDSDDEMRVQLLCQFYGNSKVVEQLIEREQVDVLLDFAEEHAGDKRTVSYLQQLFFNPKAVAALVALGRIDSMLSLARQSKDKYLKASLMRSIFGSPQVVKHFADNDQLSEMCAMINSESAEVRYQVYYNMTIRSETLTIFVENAWLVEFLNMLQTQIEAKRQGQLLGRAVVQTKVIDFLADNDQLSTIIRLAGDLEDPNARQQYLDALFSSVKAVGMLIDQGHFEALYQLASSHTNPGMRTRLRASLLTNSKAVEHLVAEKKIDLLLELVDEQTDQATRHSIVTRIAYSPTAVAALIEHGKFERLVRVCRSVADADARRRMLAELLQSDKAIERLAHDGALDEIVQEVLEEADPTVRKQLLQRLFSRSEAIDALVKHGQFDRLLEVAETESDAAQRRVLLAGLLTSFETIQHLAAQKKTELLLRVVSDEPDPTRRRQYLSRILYKPEAVQALISDGQFDALLQLLLGMPDDVTRRSLLTSLLFNSNTFEHLIENGELGPFVEALEQIDDLEFNHQLARQLLYTSTGYRILGEAKLGQKLLALLRAEPEQKNRESYARRILDSQEIWQALIDSDQVDVIYAAAKWLPDEASRRASLLKMLYAPSGLIARHLRRGETEAVERLLDEHADSDLGRLRLATCLLVTGQIDTRIHEVRGRLESAVDGEADRGEADGDRRLLIYLLRAKGDLAEACEVAEVLGDPGLLKAVCVEAGRWSRAAELVRNNACPLPIPTSHQPAEDRNQQQVEQLGLLAAYQRLGGDWEACDTTLSEVRQLSSSHPEDAVLQWLCAEALLLNGDVQHGLALVGKTHRSRAFELHVLRHEYERAMELAGWNEDTECDRKWLESLPVEEGDASDTLLARTEFALQVARMLYALGMPDEARQIVSLLDGYVDDQHAEDSKATSARRQCREQLVAALLDMDDQQAAWKLAARAFPDSDTFSGLLSRLYSRQYVEARGWWLFFREQHSVESPATTLSRVHGVLRPSPDSDSEAWTALVDQVLQGVESSTGANRKYTLLGVGQTCLRREDFTRALRCAELLTEEDDPDVLLMQAQALRGSQRWTAAAEAFYDLWRIDHSKLSALYLSGDALQQAGNCLDEAQRRKEQALTMALDSRARMGVALDLMRNGLREEALTQLRLVLRTAPFEHSEWNEAARRLGEALQKSDTMHAAELLEYSVLDDLRTWFYLLNERDYLRTPAGIHRLRAVAAIDARKFASADREIQRALTALPGDIDLAQWIVPQWEQVGRQVEADALFDQVFEVYARPMRRYPESGLLNNDSAWLLARCNRRLDEALRRAEKAVNLAPNNASYLDTLAEVRFRMGDRESALRYSRRAVDLRPGYEPLREQLQRFRNEPLPGRTPSEATSE